jgi:hypothetical protein
MRGGFWASLALLSFLLGLLLVAFFKKEEELAQKKGRVVLLLRLTCFSSLLVCGKVLKSGKKHFTGMEWW